MCEENQKGNAAAANGKVGGGHLTSWSASHDKASGGHSFQPVDSPEISRSGAPLLQLAGVGKNFGLVRVLDGVDFDLRAGEVHVLAGENGAGKSTLVKIIGGVYSDFGGEMRLDGKPVRFRQPGEASAAGIAVIHQELSLIEPLSVGQNIALGRETRTWFLDRPAEASRAREVCSWLEIPRTERELARPVEELPLGLKSRVEIAKALMGDARILVMDEPTSALNDAEVETLFRIIAKLKARGAAIVYISHKMEEIFRLADRITVLRDGRRIDVVDAAACTPGKLVELMIGRPLTRFIPPRKENVDLSTAARLEVTGFSVAHRDPRKPDVVRDFTVSVRRGEIIGLAGLEGSGCGEVLGGLFTGDRASGQVRIDDVEFTPSSPSHSIERGVALVTGDRKSTGLVLPLSVVANVSLAAMPRLSPGGFRQPARERDRAAHYVDQLGIRIGTLDQEVETLSGGNQQKVVLAKWLETHPKVLLLDEPTRGVDVGAKHEIYEFIRRLAEDGIAVLLTSTDMVELVGLCDRVVVLHRGAIAAVLQGQEINPTRILAAAMGEAAP
jgi:ribose transport system ATP-binding protein